MKADGAESRLGLLAYIGHVGYVLDVLYTHTKHTSCEINQLGKENAKGGGGKSLF